MRLNEFSDAVRNTPVFVPVFRVVKVPAWAGADSAVGTKLTRGQLLAYNPRTGRLETRKNKGLNLGASYVEFVDYLTPRDFYSSIPDSVLEASLP